MSELDTLRKRVAALERRMVETLQRHLDLRERAVAAERQAERLRDRLECYEVVDEHLDGDEWKQGRPGCAICGAWLDVWQERFCETCGELFL